MAELLFLPLSVCCLLLPTQSSRSLFCLFNFFINLLGKSSPFRVFYALSHFAPYSSISSSISLLDSPCPCRCGSRSFTSANFVVTTIDYFSVISFTCIFFLFGSETAYTGELSLVCDSLSFRSAELCAKGMGPILLVGVGIVPFATVPISE